MKILVTAGNTQALIDKVRCLTNIFTGRTGAAIALHAHKSGHNVTLLTSHPEAVPPLQDGEALIEERWSLFSYRTFEELQSLMKSKILNGEFDSVIHCAAVSDYLAAGIYAPAPGTQFEPDSGRWEASHSLAAMVDRRGGKVKSDEPELWLRLVRAPKLVDFIRSEWGFRGLLVKFKLEVGLSDAALLEVAERSRTQSTADLMVANTLEGAAIYAYLGPRDGAYQRVSRRELAARLLEHLERLHEERRHG
jgi:phosphopantothenoylcysteine synthetase/decarboxylase